MPGNDGGLILYNVYEEDDSVFAYAHQDSLIAPEQVHGVDYIQGQGLYADETFTLEFTIRSTTGVIEHCVAVFHK